MRSYFLLLCLLLFLPLCFACRSSCIERQVETQQRDSAHVATLLVDSQRTMAKAVTDERESSGEEVKEMQYIQGDTIVRTRYVTRWRDRWREQRTDTMRLMLFKTDTMRIREAQEKQAATMVRSPTRSNKVGFIGWALFLLVLLVIYWKNRNR